MNNHNYLTSLMADREIAGISRLKNYFAAEMEVGREACRKLEKNLKKL